MDNPIWTITKAEAIAQSFIDKYEHDESYDIEDCRPFIADAIYGLLADPEFVEAMREPQSSNPPLQSSNPPLLSSNQRHEFVSFTDEEIAKLMLVDPVLRANFAIGWPRNAINKYGVPVFRAVEAALRSKNSE